MQANSMNYIYIYQHFNTSKTENQDAALKVTIESNNNFNDTNPDMII